MNSERFSNNFEEQLRLRSRYPLQAEDVDTLQVNVGYVCNQECKHCHHNAGPERTEIMNREVMGKCLEVIRTEKIPTVEITGGAPEMNPNFRWFIRELTAIKSKVIVRSNLTVMLLEGMEDLPEFLKSNRVEVIASLPCYTLNNVDSQRGDGVFTISIQVLKLLNSIGYGEEGSGLSLNLIYNPGGAFLPGDQKLLEKDYKAELHDNFGIKFNNLYTITNMPIARFKTQLEERGEYESYLNLLIRAFNPEAVEKVMCRKLVSVGWDGTLYDCDFNQALRLKCSASVPQSIFEFTKGALASRNIVTGNHCLGCVAGAGSSCSGALSEV